MEELKLKLSDFDGPMDLLLTLVRENKMDIENINILTIADQYLKFVYAQQKLEINVASEYLYIASLLVWLKSKTILSFTIKLSEEEQNQIDAERQKLINQILLYKKYRDLVPKLNNFYGQRSSMFSKDADNVEEIIKTNIDKTIYSLPKQINFAALKKSYERAYEKWKLNLYNNHKIVVQEVSAEEVEKEIVNIIKKYPQTKKYALSDFFMLIDESHFSDQYLVTCFVCLLDLAKNGLLTLSQESFSDEIYIGIK